MIRRIRLKITDILLGFAMKVNPDPIVIGYITNLPDESTESEVVTVAELIRNVANECKRQIRDRIRENENGRIKPGT